MGEATLTRDHRRLAAIVSADVVGYSRLMGQDEGGTLARLKTHLAELIDPRVAEHGGRTVKSMGDGLLLEFPSVVDAVRWAVDVQNGMAERNDGVPEEQRIRFRVGIHVGDIISDGDDIFGEGVNVAARLQALASPGGICLSERAYDDVRDRLPIDFADGGEHALKNIARPVRIRHWTGAPAAPAALPEATAPLPLPDKPSIAVLPFDNMSGDPEQEYFADGIAEDLITELSRFRELFVIARNSTFVFKGTAVDIQDVARRLGVRYVVEGSVRRTGNRVRVSAQLIEAPTGRHVWAERYDRELDDIFAAQDEVTQAIVAAVAPAVGELERARARPPCCSTSAWELHQRGLWHVYRYNRDDLVSAIELFERAIAVDARFAPAHAGLAYALYAQVIWGHVAPPGPALERARRTAMRAVALDPRDAFSRVVLGRTLMTSGEVGAALTECERAVELNPNLAAAHYALGYALGLAGRPEEALASIGRAIRLSPYDPLMHAFLTLKSAMMLILGRFEEALAVARDAQRWPSATAWAWLHEAAALASVDRLEAAGAAMRHARALQPDVSQAWLRTLLPVAPGVNIDAYFDAMRKAGLPD
jgi:adenylate cyclase